MKKVLLFFVFLGLTAGFDVVQSKSASKNLEDKKSNDSKIIQLKSPDGNLIVSFKIIENAPIYAVKYKDQIVVEDSKLNLSFKEDADFSSKLELLKPVFRERHETYDLIIGKAKTVYSHCREMLLPFNEKGSERRINLIFQAFDDGIAFRYEFPAQKSWDSYTLTDERSEFRLANNPKAHTLFLPNFTTSHEGFYTKILLDEIKDDTLMDMPTLFEFPNKIYAAITEANLRDYAGMYLMKHKGILASQLSPLPNQTEIKVKAVLPHRTPWRVLMISDRIGGLIESNILTNLNEPNVVKDTSWIKPGKTDFPWWNGNIVDESVKTPGNNFETAKYYIDFCARNKIEYHSVVEYGGHEWYKSDGVDFQPGPDTDILTVVPELDMQKICDYAKSKGVGVRVWVHWKALYPKLEAAFTQFEKWGISGMMVDFMDRDDQEMVNIQEEILKRAAAHRLHIQFHGAYKPTGLSRTYPNEFTREGTRNYEVNKWDENGLSPDQDIAIPFTRMLAGSTDYHLGGFRAVLAENFKPNYVRPVMLGTRTHQLAMYVVLENALGMVADYPQAYENQTGFDFIKEVPTVWDETRVLNAEVGEFITIARCKNADWYIGTINNSKTRKIKISLDFLAKGNYSSVIYSDADDTAQNPNHSIKQNRMVNSKDTLEINLGAGGGSVIVLKKP